MGSNAPYGKYTFDINKTTINGQSYNDNKIIKASTHGAENALLSLLVPGLGDHRVSYGKRKGIGVALSTYALIGGGIGLKVYSNREYKKYHAATTQDAMDNHYRNANYSNQAFYGCLVAGGIIWLSDIIWVMVKGAQNTKAMKAYRQSHLSAYYDPNTQAACLYYTLNF